MNNKCNIQLIQLIIFLIWNIWFEDCTLPAPSLLFPSLSLSTGFSTCPRLCVSGSSGHTAVSLTGNVCVSVCNREKLLACFNNICDVTAFFVWCQFIALSVPLVSKALMFSTYLHCPIVGSLFSSTHSAPCLHCPFSIRSRCSTVLACWLGFLCWDLCHGNNRKKKFFCQGVGL